MVVTLNSRSTFHSSHGYHGIIFLPSPNLSPFTTQVPRNFFQISCFFQWRLMYMQPKIVFRDSLPPIRVHGLNSKFLKVVDIMHLVISLGILLAMDKLLKNAFMTAAIKFPSALFGMFCIFTALTILDLTVPTMASTLMSFFEPALMFIQRWLPLFYVPCMVVLPLAVKDIPASSGLKICFIIVGGWLASLAVAGYTAIAVRNIVKTEMTDAEPMAKPAPFSSTELRICCGIFLISFVVALIYPTLLGTNARTCLPFLLSSTVLGYMVGSG